MKSTQLKLGQQVLITPSLGISESYCSIFIERVPCQNCRPAYSIIRIPGFAGLHGTGDLGDTLFSDYMIIHQVQPLGNRAYG